MKQFSSKLLLLALMLFQLFACKKDDKPLQSPAQNNLFPKADAGPDQIVDFPLTTLKLTGSGQDMDGTIISYYWDKMSGPASFTIVSPRSASTEVQNLTPGNYVFMLQVTDNSGGTDNDRIWVEVKKDPNVIDPTSPWDY